MNFAVSGGNNDYANKSLKKEFSCSLPKYKLAKMCNFF